MKNLVQKYLLLNKYINEEKQFNDLFSSHPNYPNLYTITDSLDILGIENVAAKIENDNQFALVTKREDAVIITNEKLKNTTYTFQEFATDLISHVIQLINLKIVY